jgi:hypothetical protein
MKRRGGKWRVYLFGRRTLEGDAGTADHIQMLQRALEQVNASRAVLSRDSVGFKGGMEARFPELEKVARRDRH